MRTPVMQPGDSVPTVERYAPEVTAWVGVERAPSFMRKLVELLVYVAVLNSVFQQYIGLSAIPLMSGGLFVLSGLAGVCVLLAEGQRLPLCLWIALVMNVAANASQVLGHGAVPVISAGLSPMMQWLGTLAAIYVLVQNEGSRKRFVLFLAVTVIATVATGGVAVTYRRIGARLAIEGVGGIFANANSLAYVSGVLAMALLFWSLRAMKICRPFLWATAFVLILIVFRTVSRGGIATLLCGLAVLMIAILLGRGVRIGGCVLVVVAVLVLSQLAFLFQASVRTLDQRRSMRDARARLGVYSMETIRDLRRTVVVGRGLEHAALSRTGVNAHNAFVHTHVALGGPTAWTYLLWLMVLSIRLLRMVLAQDYPLNLRMEVVCLFGMACGCQLMDNFGYFFITAVYAMVVTEKYTAPYSRRRILERRMWESWMLCDSHPAGAVAVSQR